MKDQALATSQKTKEHQFEILHHSYRMRWASGQKFAEKFHLCGEGPEEIPDWQYYSYNLVFRAFDDFKGMCLAETKNWKEGSVCIDTQKYDEYIEGIDFDFGDEEIREPAGEYNGEPYYPLDFKNNSGIDRDSLFVKGHIENFSPFLIYIEKFDVFWFREYLQYHPATTGIIKFIDELKEGKSYGITCSYHQFYCCLKSLEYFWD
jgi:hypothetical protein